VLKKILLILLLSGCTSAPKFDAHLVRPWQSELEQEYLSKKPFIARHKAKDFEIFYLAAHHDNDPNSQTMQLIDKLFQNYKFDVLIIEPFPNSKGESPQWYLDLSRKSIGKSLIVEGESSYAVIKANDKAIPFFGGEIDHLQLYLQLKIQGYTTEDVIGFYLVRQIPQWIRQKKAPAEMLKKDAPQFLKHYCKDFEVPPTNCPDLAAIKLWYRAKMNKELTPERINDEVAPIYGSTIFTQKISSAVGDIRDRFTLNLIQTYLKKYKRVAVIYGKSHYITLRKSIDAAMGPPVEVVD
jgi:hypothetical protein